MRPHLSSHFFTKHGPSVEFYEKWKSSHKWSADCLPVYEWQGLLYVATTSEDIPAPPGLHCIMVMASAASLDILWGQWNAPHAKLDLQTTVPHEISSPALSIAEDHSNALSSSSGEVNLEPVEEVKKSTEKPKAVAAKAPTPAAATKQGAASEDLFAGFQSSISESSTEEKSEGEESDSLLQLSDEDSEESSEKSEESSSEEEPSEEKLELDIPPPPDMGQVLKTDVASPAASALKPLQASEPTVEPTENNENSDAAALKPVAEKAPVTKPSAKTSTTKPAAAASSISTEKTDWMTDVFNQISGHYQKSMLLLLAGMQLRPLKWSSGFQQDTDTVGTISIEDPSAFRLVYRTSRPYHGYVVPGEVNDRFFEQWNKNVVPDLWTIAPILIEDNLLGVLVSLGTSSANNKASLALMEKLANEIGTQVKANPQILKAA